MSPVAVDALVHGLEEICIAPAADTGLGIRGDVRGIQRAEIRHERPTAGERLATFRRMARLTVGRLGQVASARNGI